MAIGNGGKKSLFKWPLMEKIYMSDIIVVLLVVQNRAISTTQTYTANFQQQFNDLYLVTMFVYTELFDSAVPELVDPPLSAARMTLLTSVLLQQFESCLPRNAGIKL